MGLNRERIWDLLEELFDIDEKSCIDPDFSPVGIEIYNKNQRRKEIEKELERLLRSEG